MPDLHGNFDGSMILQECSPLVKWPGGKRRLLPQILDVVPAEFDRYYEPFFGGGALFFALQPRRSTLSDANSDLVQMLLPLPQSGADVLTLCGVSGRHACPMTRFMRAVSTTAGVSWEIRLIRATRSICVSSRVMSRKFPPVMRITAETTSGGEILRRSRSRPPPSSPRASAGPRQKPVRGTRGRSRCERRTADSVLPASPGPAYR